jgi:hypothetical protein
MKYARRRSLLAATLVTLASALASTPTAQACVIDVDGECLAAATSQTSRGDRKQQPAKPTARSIRQKQSLAP